MTHVVNTFYIILHSLLTGGVGKILGDQLIPVRVWINDHFKSIYEDL